MTRIALRRGVQPAARDKRLVAVTDFNPQVCYQSQPLGGEAGVSTGFGSALLVMPRRAIQTSLRIAGRSNNANVGWLWLTYASIYAQVFTGSSPTFVNSNAQFFNANDVGKIFLLLQWYDAPALHLYSGRAGLLQTTAGGSVAQSSYAPYNDGNFARQFFGNMVANDANGAKDAFALLGLLTFRGTTPVQQYLQDFYDKARQLGDMPQTLQGVTVTHRWSAKDVYARSKPITGRVTNLARKFNGDANCLRANVGFRGSATGWWLAFYFVPESLSSYKRLYHNLSGFSNGSFGGISMMQQLGTIAIETIDGTGTYAGANIVATMVAGDLGKPQIVVLNYDGTNLSMYYRRALVASIARTFTPSAGGSTLAWVCRAYQAALEPAPIASFVGMQGSDASSLTQAEALAIYDNFVATGQVTQLGPKTQKLWNVHQDVIDSGNGTVPGNIQERMGTGDAFVRLGNLTAGTYTEDGVVSPPALPDTITAAAVDQLDRAGDPRMMVIDPATYDSSSSVWGVRNVSNGVHLATAVGKGIRGATSFWGHWYGRFDKLTGGLVVLAANTVTGAGGWQLYGNLNNGVITFNVVGNTNRSISSPVNTVVAADLEKPQQVQFVYDGTAVYLYYQRRLVAQVACDGFIASTTTPMSFGGRSNNDIAGINNTYFALQGGDGYVPSVGELQAAYDLTEATGKLQPLPGSTPAGVLRTQHLWDLNLDVKENGGPAAGLPAQFKDRIGTDHMTPTAPGLILGDLKKPSVGRVQAGVMAFSDVSGYETTGLGLVGGPEFHYVWRGQFLRVPSTTQCLMTCVNDNGTAGCHLQIAPNGSLRFGSAGGQFSAAFAITSAMLNTTFVIHAVCRNGQLQIYLDGVQQGADVAASSGNAAATTGIFSVGHYRVPTLAAQQGATDVLCFECGGGEFGLGQDDISAQVADAQKNGILASVSGRTTHLYQFGLDIAANGGVEMGPPAVVLDRVGTAHLYYQGMTVSPALNGIRGVGPFAQGDGFMTIGGGGTQGNSTLFYVEFDIVLFKVPGATEIVASVGNGSNTGWFVMLQGGANLVLFGGLAGIAYSGAVTLTNAASWLNKRIRILMQRTNATTLQFWVNGTQASDASVSGYGQPPATAPMVLGGILGGNGLQSGYIEGAVGSVNTGLSPSEITAQFADLTTALYGVSGKTMYGWNFDTAIREAGGRVPTVVSTSAPAVRMGTPLLLTSRNDKLWTYDDKPILYGAKGDYFASYNSVAGGGFDGSPSGFMVEILAVILTLNVSSANRCIVGKRPNDSIPGWDIRTSGTNNVWQFACGGGSANGVSPSMIMQVGDIGRPFLFTGVWDAPNQMIRAYCKRARLGTGTTLTTYAPTPAETFMLGGRTGANAIGPFVAILGFRCGNFIPTLNEVVAANDHLISTEKFVPGAYPGRVFANHYTIPTSTPPATLVDQMGNTNLTHTGTPVANDVNARLWAA